MVNLFPNNSILRISNGIIESINADSRNTLITVSYSNQENFRQREQTIVLVVGNNTTILNERGFPISARELKVGMIINAAVSSVMTRSIPPESSALLIRIINRSLPKDIVTTGRILEIDQQNRTFTTIQRENPSSVIRFNVPQNTTILNRGKRPVPFSFLTPGMRVRVRHATFMTASIPPQTTAFEIQIL